MKTFLAVDFIENHLKTNITNADYQTYMNRKMYDLNGIKLVLNMEEVLKSKSLIEKIELNVILAKNRLQIKHSNRKPSVGDFIKIGDKYYRIAIFTYEDNFQYTIDGSFYIGKEGQGSYSGGFNFEHGGTINLSELTPFPIEKKEGSFWFFSNDWTGGNRGVHFKEEFNVWGVQK